MVIMRYLGGGGSKDFALIQSKDEFENLVQICPEGTDIIVFRDKQLPVRGIVNDKLIDQARQTIPETSEYLFMLRTPDKPDDPICFGEFDYRSAMEQDIREWIGHEVAVGVCPHFIGPDNESMISASKGGIDGPR